MSTTIDSKVVEMQFDNKQFEKNVQTSLGTLDKLKQSLKLSDASKGLENVGNAAKSVNMSALSKAVETVHAKFSALQIIGVTALTNITNSAINTGKKLISSVVNPLVEGGKNRALNIEQAKFQFKGLGMDVDKAMESASAAVKGTAYGLDSAAKVASQFGASGMKAGKEMTKSLRAVAGVAAMTGSSYDDIGNIFTTISGNGRLMGDQLLQLSGRGINAAATLGKYLNKSEAEIREMVSEGEISFETFYKAMDNAFGEHAKDANKTFTGAMSNVKAALSRIGADVATPAFEDMRNVMNALIPVIDNIHEALKPLIDDISNIMKKTSKSLVKKLNNINLEWISPVIKGVENSFKGLLSILKPIQTAFREIFPKSSASEINQIADNFRKLTEKFKIGNDTSKNLKNTFKGLFAIIDIVKKAISAIIKPITSMSSNFGSLGGKILSITGGIGEYIVKLDKSIEKSDTFNKAVKKITDFVQKATDKVREFINVLKSKIGTPGLTSAEGILKRIHTRTSQIGNIANKVKNQISKAIKGIDISISKCTFVQVLQTVWTGVKKIVGSITTSLGTLAGSITKKLGDANFSGILDLINGIISGGLSLSLIKLFKSLTKTTDDFKGTFDTIKGILNGVKGCLVEYQKQIKAKTLLTIASAIGILSASIIALSLVDSDKLNVSIGAMTMLFADLVGSMAIYNKFSSTSKNSAKSAKTMIAMALSISILAGAMNKIAKLNGKGIAKGLTTIAGLSAILTITMKAMSNNSKRIIKGTTGLIAFSVAIKILVSACKDLSQLNWNQLAKGLVGVGVLMGEISIFSRTAKFSRNSVSTATGIVILSSAIVILSKACANFSNMNWSELSKGLTSIGILLGEIAIFTKITGNTKHVISTGVSLIAISAGIKIFASAIKDLGSLSWSEISKGLVGIAGALTAITVSVKLMPKNMVGIGIGLISVSTALLILSHSLDKLGNMSWSEVGKGLTSLAGSMLILSVALHAMKGTISGSLSLVIATTALLGLTPVLKTLGSMSWESIAKGLVTLAGAFTIIGVAGLLLKPIVPTILALSGAFALLGLGVTGIGVGLLAAGTGLSALAVGFTALATAGSVGATAIASSLTIIISGIAGLIPAIIKKIGEGIVEFCKAIYEGAPEIGKAFKAVVLTIIDVLVECVPKLVDGALLILTETLKSLAKYTPEIVDSIFDFLINLLEGVAKNLPDLISAVVDVIMAFFSGVIQALKGIDTSTLLQGIAGVGIMSAMMLALNAVATLAPGAMLGVLGMGAVIAELALVLAAIGALGKIPGLNWLIDEGGKVLQGIGTAIGSFVGGIVGGFMKGVSSQFAQIGTDLSDFMTNVQPFIDGASRLDPSTLDGVKALGETILILTAANILDGLTSWFTGGSSIADFAEDLVPLGTALKTFSNEIAGMDGKVVANAATAGKTLAEMADALPNTGGVLGFFAGENDMDEFGRQLIPFGKAIKEFSTTVVGIDSDAVTNAATAGKAVAEMADTLPNTGGVVGWFVGNNDMDEFGRQLIPFGKAMKEFSTTVVGLDTKAITDASTAGKAVSALADSIPETGGVVGWFVGNNDMDEFGEQLIPFGKAMKTFSDEIMGLDEESIINAATAGKSVSELANSLPNDGGVVEWFTGGNDIGDFGNSLIVFGKSFAEYSDYMKNIDCDIVTKSSNAAKSIVELANNLPEDGLFSGTQTIDDFGDDLEDFGDCFNDYYSEISAIDTGKLSSVNDEVSRLILFAQGMSNINTDGMENFGDALKDIGNEGINQFIDAFKNSFERIKNTATNMLNNFIDGMNSKKDSVGTTAKELVNKIKDNFSNKSEDFYSKGKSLVNKLINGISDKKSDAVLIFSDVLSDCVLSVGEYYSDFYDAGKFLVTGFANGITDNTYLATAKSREMALAAANAARDELDIHSPSRVGYEIGDFFGLGFTNALNESASNAYKSGSNIANSANDGLVNAISKISSILDGTVEYQPTIRPVMDLSNVQNGANQLFSMMNDISSYSINDSVSFSNSTATTMSNRRNIDFNNSEKLSEVIRLLKDDSTFGDTTINNDNTFNINGNNPREIAEEVSTILQHRVERSSASWA